MSAFFGLYGIFIGMMVLIIKLSSISTFGYSYLSPFAPLIKTELRDSIIKTRNTKIRFRNPLLAKKNLIRGYVNEED